MNRNSAILGWDVGGHGGSIAAGSFSSRSARWSDPFQALVSASASTSPFQPFFLVMLAGVWEGSAAARSWLISHVVAGAAYRWEIYLQLYLGFIDPAPVSSGTLVQEIISSEYSFSIGGLLANLSP